MRNKKVLVFTIFLMLLFTLGGVNTAFSQGQHKLLVGLGNFELGVNIAFADRSHRILYPRELSLYESDDWNLRIVDGGGIIIGAKDFQAKAYYPIGISHPDFPWVIADSLFSYFAVDAVTRYTFDLDHSTVPVSGGHKRYWKYLPPVIEVNGELVNPIDGEIRYWDPVYDELNESMVCEQMATSVCNTSMGITVTERAYAFMNPKYTDFAIVEYIFKNTGETGSLYKDRTPITYPDNTLNDCYVAITLWPQMRETRIVPESDGNHPGNDEWVDYTHAEDMDGDGLLDTLRVLYGWDGDAGLNHQQFDDEGDPLIFTSGVFLNPFYPGMAVLHADKAPGNPVNDMNQPHGSYYSNRGATGVDNALTVGNQSLGYRGVYEILEDPTHIVPPLDWTEWKNSQTENWLRNYWYTTEQPVQIGNLIFGPYQFQSIGDSIRIVLCYTVGEIGWSKAIELGAWWRQRYQNPTPEDTKYKNQILRSGRDSLFTIIKEVRELFKTSGGSYNFSLESIAANIPSAPPWPAEIKLSSVVGGCKIEWSEVSGTAAYRIYRQLPRDFSVESPLDTAVFPLVFQCGGNNPDRGAEYSSDIVTSWIDVNVVPARHYRYYVTAVNNEGIESSQYIARVYGTSGNPLRGSVTPFETPPVTLDSVYIIPNPYHSKAVRKLYNRDEDILDFVGLPAACRIRIFTQSGDLVATIQHEYQYPPSSSEAWEMRTSTDQTLASGVYVYAVDECRDHNNKPINKTKVGKFVVIR
jgi:hypothetical protein